MAYADLKTAVVAELEDWFRAVEDGMVGYRMPMAKPPTYMKDYSDDDIDRLVAAIDDEIDGEISRNSSHWNAKGINTGSGFSRLQSLQKRALVERLATIYHEQDVAPDIIGYDDLYSWYE